MEVQNREETRWFGWAFEAERDDLFRLFQSFVFAGIGFGGLWVPGQTLAGAVVGGSFFLAGTRAISKEGRTWVQLSLGLAASVGLSILGFRLPAPNLLTPVGILTGLGVAQVKWPSCRRPTSPEQIPLTQRKANYGATSSE